MTCGPNGSNREFVTTATARRLKCWGQQLKAELLSLWFCCQHPQTPLAAKALAALVVAYAFSPIDLIPDFIPVLGYLDDVIILPLGIWLTLKLVPPPVLTACRAQAQAWLAENKPRPRSYLAATVIVLIWLLALWLAWRWLGPQWMN